MEEIDRERIFNNIQIVVDRMSAIMITREIAENGN
jgi:hypothetical protein